MRVASLVRYALSRLTPTDCTAIRENSVGYNGISVQILVNVLPMILPAAATDRHAARNRLLLKSFAGYFDPSTDCMPPFGASNTACESTSLFM